MFTSINKELSIRFSLTHFVSHVLCICPLSVYSCMSVRHTLLNIIKGTHISNGITGLPNMLQCMHVVCMVGDWLTYIKSHG